MKQLIKINKNKKLEGPACRQAGMTYVELIVVLGIFALLSTVAIYNYGGFQAKVDIKNLASNIALKVVEAQKSATSGLLPQLSYEDDWKPSYGVYFNRVTEDSRKSFIYFADLNSDFSFDGSSSDCTGECLERTVITKNNVIDDLSFVLENSDIDCGANELTIVFKRPGSIPVITTSGGELPSCSFGFSYAQISITSPRGANANIKIYPSGRIQVN